MQFLKNGPDIPETLLQAHEEGKVIFFCGAGIAYPANLPGFDGLVKRLYSKLGVAFSEIEKETFDRKQYDTTIDLLERRFPGQRAAVRAALPSILKPKFSLPGAADTHAALLELARDRHGAVRIVTTNFDRIFQRQIGAKAPRVAAFQAPLLPIPKSSKWNGIVYLHGLLPAKNDPAALNKLVLSSGDFGMAYLTERWAARFVSELFRNYVVCFVGYSINDPVLRYMMDALAADRMLGELVPQAYAFGEYKAGENGQRRSEWLAKGVVPILYEISDDGRDHSNLHRSIIAWSETYRDGVRGKERIAAELGLVLPTASSKEDDFVGRLLWALCDPGGLPAMRFAELDPVPSLDWLQPLEELRYKYEDLSRFGVSSYPKGDNSLAFSLTSRPAPHTLSPWMELLPREKAPTRWDDVMVYLARWLLRHLNDPALFLWVAKRGGGLHNQFKFLLENQLDKLAELELKSDHDELERLKSSAPRAVPGPLMRKLWRLLLAGCISSDSGRPSLYEWKRRFDRDGMMPSLRYDLRRCFTPRITVREPFRFWTETGANVEPTNVRDLVDWELSLNAEYAGIVLRDLDKIPEWQESLSLLVDDFTILLKDALDLMQALDASDDRDSNSHWAMPSISNHWQNRDFQEWIALIAVTRDAFLSAHRLDPRSSYLIAEGWWRLPYPLFKRLALFAASQGAILAATRWVDWLTSDDRWWLWTTECQREVMRLLVLQGSTVGKEDLIRIQDAIVTGPPVGMYRQDADPERLARAIEHGIWLRLAKLRASGADLAPAYSARMDELQKYGWKLEADESDEFSHWLGGTGDPGYEDRARLLRVPRSFNDLVNWLQQPPSDDPFERNDWSEFCRDRLPITSRALRRLAQQNIWPIDYWRDALHAWSADELLAGSWRRTASIISTMPDDVLYPIAHSLAWWLQAQSKTKDIQEETFMIMVSRLLAMEHEYAVRGADELTTSINHPVGQVTQALLNLWLGRGPRDGDGLREDIKTVFTKLCDRTIDGYSVARVILCANVIALFRVAPTWAMEHLLPLFNWNESSTDALTAWRGFLWSPRLYRPLFSKIKESFLATAGHFDDLGRQQRQFTALLTYAALDPGDTFANEELRHALMSLPQAGLEHVASTLTRALSDAGEQRESYFQNRIRPFWRNVWPQDLQYASVNIAESLAQLCVEAKNCFPMALDMVRDWLQTIPRSMSVLHLLRESKLCVSYPQEALTLLAIITNASGQFAFPDLGQSLQQIAMAWPEARGDTRYRRLEEFMQRRGG